MSRWERYIERAAVQHREASARRNARKQARAARIARRKQAREAAEAAATELLAAATEPTDKEDR